MQTKKDKLIKNIVTRMKSVKKKKVSLNSAKNRLEITKSK